MRMGTWIRLMHSYRGLKESAAGVRPLLEGLLQRRCLSAQSRRDACSQGSVLVRDFIQDSLYNPSYGYFANSPSVVGTIDPINFGTLKGEREYNELLDRRWKGIDDRSWLTPVEIFQPWYGRALGEYILRRHNSSQHQLQVYEIGGGSGTCAVNILDYIKEKGPEVYRTMKYTSVEISAELAKRQRRRVDAVHSHKGRFSVENRSAVEREGWGKRSLSPCFIILLEVLDNLPHDRVVWDPTAGWRETRVRQVVAPGGTAGDQQTETWAEEEHALADPLIQQCLEASGIGGGSSLPNLPILHRALGMLGLAPNIRWLPTVCLKLLHTLLDARPRATIVASDFDFLPERRILGDGAPLVASKVKGRYVDHDTYLVRKGTADIFFPTDFSLTERMEVAVMRELQGSMEGRRAHVAVSTEDFMRRYAEIDKSTTQSGFNPLLDTFTNQWFYVSTHTGN